MTSSMVDMRPASAAHPAISVIVLSYNQARFVEACLESVRRQSMSDFELIICDDCSTDDSLERIRAWCHAHWPDAIVLAHASNRGVCSVLNEAVALARGTYISMIAADDLWEPDKLESQLEVMAAQPRDVAVVYSDAALIDEMDTLLPGRFIDRYWPALQPPSGHLLPYFATRNFVPAMATLIRTSAIRAVGGYDEELPYEDYDMWIRLSARFRFLYMPATVACYRTVAGSLTQRVSNFEDTVALRAHCRIATRILSIAGVPDQQRDEWIAELEESARQLYRHDDAQASQWLWSAFRAGRSVRTLALFAAAKLRVSHGMISLLRHGSRDSSGPRA